MSKSRQYQKHTLSLQCLANYEILFFTGKLLKTEKFTFAQQVSSG